MSTPFSPIRKLVPFADIAKKNGVKVFHLNIGDPDIETPEVMLNALKNFKPKIIAYSNSKGDVTFLNSLLFYYHKLGFKDLDLSNLQVTSGGSEGIFWTFLALCNPQDEILVFEPFYANYNGFAKTAEVKLVSVLTKIEDGFHLPLQKEIEKKITKKTKAILICNPNNPTGTLYTKAELKMLLSIAKKHKLYLLSDEVYREFVYDGKIHTSLLSFNYKEGIIVLDSLSKRYSLCGARLGCIVSRNKDFIAEIQRFAQVRLSAGFIDQIVASKLTEVSKDYLSKVNREYKKRRDLVVKMLGNIPGVVFRVPEGAFYIIVGLPVDNAENFAKWLLTDFRYNNSTIMVTPAAGFYKTSGRGMKEVRLAYVINLLDLEKSMLILKNALEKYNKL
ncbi:MAG: pyridoxal phosphate-dependent aminotransferase [Patescibacteria group bacterium]|nr:pyridoxal phosphate-dependent aminotransferase [Patescibacteria group bacterium]